MDIKQKIDKARDDNKLYLMIFYADWSPHYEWMDKAIKEEDSNIEVIRINVEGDKKVADEFDVGEEVPTFILKKGSTTLWRQKGEVIPNEFKDIITMFNSK